MLNMNINLNQRKLHLGQPIMRHLSTIGFVATKPDQNLLQNVPTRFFTTFGSNICYNKSFSNPNFVNKEHPNILAGSLNVALPKTKPLSPSQMKFEAMTRQDGDWDSPVGKSRRKRKNKTARKGKEAKQKQMDCTKPVQTRSEPNRPRLDPSQFRLESNQIRSEPIQIVQKPRYDVLRTLSSSSDNSLSPCSPAICRLRFPSDCDSDDSFVVFCDDANSDDDSSTSDLDITDSVRKTDLNQNDTTKKKVTFKCDSELCEVHPMLKWGFAYQSARIGPWEQCARDRARFEARIRNSERILAPILQPAHRIEMYKQRFACDSNETV